VHIIAWEFVVLFLILLIFGGSLQWFKRASQFERLYVILSLSFLVWTSLMSRSLFVVIRHWLHVLPFLILSAALGCSIIYKKIKKAKFRMLAKIFISLLVILIFQNGIFTFWMYASPAKREYFKNAQKTLKKVKIFLDENTDPEVRLATVDWGVLPFVLKRTSYQILNDKSHLLTFNRMKKYQTKYLIYLDHINAFPPSTRKMVKEFPGVFTLVMEAKPPNRNGPKAAVYKIDLTEIDKILKNS
jgi:hypothetical protein